MARHEPQASGAGGLRTVYRFLLGRLGALSVWLLRLLVPPVSGMKMTRRHPACCPGPACHQAVLNSNASPAHITFPAKCTPRDASCSITSPDRPPTAAPAACHFSTSADARDVEGAISHPAVVLRAGARLLLLIGRGAISLRLRPARGFGSRLIGIFP